MVAAGEEVKQLEDLCAAADLCTYCPDMGRGGGGRGGKGRHMTICQPITYGDTRIRADRIMREYAPI